MKKLLLASLLICQVFRLNGQPITYGPTGFFLNESRDHFSAKGDFLKPIPAALGERYLVQGTGLNQYVRAIIGLSPQARLESWQERGLRFRPVSATWRTADIPLSQLYAVLRSADFTHFEMDSRCFALMDTARSMQDVNRVHD
ncbi:MAG: hypothetical protein KF690_03710, partial [Bacteroidetes bacterium]|nr:hypothetical protein [Bacteroidota bacterium]